MEQSLFYKTFLFRRICRPNKFHMDHSGGVRYHYIIRMRTGNLVIRTLSGEEFQCKKGDIVYLPKGAKYHYYCTTDGTEDSSTVWESFGFQQIPVNNNLKYTIQKISPLAEAIQWLDHLSQNKKSFLASVGYLYLFLSEVLPHMTVFENDPKRKLLNTAIEYIKKNKDFTVSELAHACCISESGLYTLFRNYAHMSPIEFKHRLKIERAVELLISTDLPIETIATSLGFCSSSYFRRVLKKQTGCTPSQIRKDETLM